MKVVREILYEKFEEKSDPVSDMGIGKIKPDDIYNEFVSPGIKKWQEFVKSLAGKTITGKFGDMISDATLGGAAQNRRWFSIPLNPNAIPDDTIYVVNAILKSPTSLTIYVMDETGKTHIMYGSEEYLIK